MAYVKGYCKVCKKSFRVKFKDHKSADIAFNEMWLELINKHGDRSPDCTATPHLDSATVIND